MIEFKKLYAFIEEFPVTVFILSLLFTILFVLGVFFGGGFIKSQTEFITVSYRDSEGITRTYIRNIEFKKLQGSIFLKDEKGDLKSIDINKDFVLIVPAVGFKCNDDLSTCVKK